LVKALGRRIRVGDVAGSYDGRGYIHIQIHKKTYRANRLAWLYVYGVWPKNQIDHINQIRDADWIANLREATIKENNKNKPLRVDNASGFTGVYWYAPSEKWRVGIKVDGKQIHLGFFKDKSEAVSARKAADIRYGFHKNHGAVIAMGGKE